MCSKQKNMVNIFEQGSELTETWFNFKAIGDGIQGTYVNKKMAIDSFGNEQVVYQLKTADKGVMNVGIKATKKKFHELMDGVRFGQIIGIKFTEKRPNEGKNDTNVYKIFSDEKIVDKEWMDNMEKYGNIEDATIGESFNMADEKEPTYEDINIENLEFVQTPEEKIADIIDLAKEKFKITDEDPNKVKEIVMEKTELPFVTANIDAILEKLKSL